MTSRERVRTTLAHREPDRVPVDFGGTTVTGMHALVVERLRAHYGLERRPVTVPVPYNMLGLVEDDLAKAMGLDLIGVLSRNTNYGYPNENWKEFRTPWGQVVLVSGHFQYTTDTNGDLLTYPQGDVTAPPSGRMPPSSFFFDTIIRQDEIVEEALNPEDNLQEFGPLSDLDVAHFTERIAAAAATERAVIVAIGGTGFGDIALVPAPGLRHPKGIRDITEWYVSLATRQEYVEAVFTRQCEIALGRLAQTPCGGGKRHRHHLPVRNRFRDAGLALLLSGDLRPTLGAALPAAQRLGPQAYDLEDDEAHLRCGGVVAVAPLRRRFRHLQSGPVLGRGDGAPDPETAVR